jgi:outer membrane protein OmpA-like peptidoglycan-associated protein
MARPTTRTGRFSDRASKGLYEHPAFANKKLRSVIVAVSVAMAALTGFSCGAELKGRADGVNKLIKLAWDHGAYRCAPKDLTLAEANLRFAREHLSQGNYHNADHHMELADEHARAALRKSPKEKCAPRKVVEAPRPRPRPRPVKVEVKVVDTDKDGIPDNEDECPKNPEDKDGFADEDGCPEPDNDGDKICDDHPDVQNRLADFADKCKGKDECTGTEADKVDGFAKTKEDADGFEDTDGCPDPDNDGDKICDSNTFIQSNVGHWKEKCQGSDKCAGTDSDKANGFAKTKEDVDKFEDTDGCPDPDNDSDKICDDNQAIQSNIALWTGQCKGKDKCSGTDSNKANNFKATKEVYNNFKDTDGCPDKLKLIVVTKKRIELKQKVYFDFNKARIKRRSYPLLNEVAQVLEDRPSMEVRIEGHTDSRGSRRYNRRLSRRRARAVRRYLIRKGIDSDRLVSKGYGEAKPIATNRTAEGREKNRRVEFHITKR